jgi:Fe-S-cluster-containing hydrogenase component 2
VNLDGRLDIVDAEACTGCRLCELLCPDFAITITPPPAPVILTGPAVGAGDRP